MPCTCFARYDGRREQRPLAGQNDDDSAPYFREGDQCLFYLIEADPHAFNLGDPIPSSVETEGSVARHLDLVGQGLARAPRFVGNMPCEGVQ